MITMDSIKLRSRVRLAGAMLALCTLTLSAQTPAPPASEAPAPAASTPTPAAAPTPAAPTMSIPGQLAALGWLSGCWRGEVGLRRFQEHWLPMAGSMLVGVSQTYAEARTYSYEYLRMENRADGLYYVIASPGAGDTTFKYEGTSTDGEATIHTFRNVNAATAFPMQMSYRRDTGGRLFASMKGKINNAEREVIYPLLRINCESGELVSQ